jgi:hypothetical protein
LNPAVRGRTVVIALALVAVTGVAVAAGAVGLNVLGPPGSVRAPSFVEEAQSAGLHHAYEGGFDYFVGGGVATFDCNDDGLPELYFAGGQNPAALFINRSAPGGALAFEARPSTATDLAAVTGAYPIDVDGDGETDLAVLRHGENVLLRGLGECTFERANELWRFDGGDRWSTAFSAKWERASEWPTVAIGNYLTAADANGLRACEDNEMHTPATDGETGFGDSLSLTPSWCTLSLLFTDWDRSGRRDLRVSNDRHYYSDQSEGAEQLWRVAAGEPPRQYTEADGWKRLRVFGMGIGDYDVNDDGYPDYYLTSQADNKLQVLANGAASPEYEDIALARGANAPRPHDGDTTLPSTAWHAEFQDVNNDGFEDLFVSKGNVEAMPDFAARDPSNLLLGQADGSFSEASQAAGILDFGRARGAALADLNLDGLLDLVVVRRVQNVLAYRNVGMGDATQPAAMGNWVALDLEWDDANRDAIGSWIEVRAGEHLMQRELTIGGGHVSGELGPLHFGIGSSGQAEVRVTWPDGARSDWQSVAANRIYEISVDEAPREVTYQ